jgi:hypothetical protein
MQLKKSLKNLPRRLANLKLSKTWSWIAKKNLKLAKKVQLMKVAAAARVNKTAKSVKLCRNKSHKLASLLLK